MLFTAQGRVSRCMGRLRLQLHQQRLRLQDSLHPTSSHGLVLLGRDPGSYSAFKKCKSIGLTTATSSSCPKPLAGLCRKAGKRKRCEFTFLSFVEYVTGCDER